MIANVGWTVRDGDAAPRALDPRVVPLLEAIARAGTLRAATQERSLPYRTAWGLLEDVAKHVGTPLVVRERGRGTRLSTFATKLIAANEAASRVLTGRVPPLVVDEPAARAAGSKPRLAIAASHDIALAQLRDGWRVAHGVAIEFHGSVDSLAVYAVERVDVAGFHVTCEAGSDNPLLQQVRRSRDVLLRFLRREQGLILRSGNPRRVRALRDVASKRLTMINRQPGSGTRLLLDRLLLREGIDASALPGYSNEEFTHAAVAATVAAGKADVGFGIAAAAAQFGLAFVPIAEERYLFVCRRTAAETPPLVAFRAMLASAATRAVVRPLPGYRLDRPGSIIDVEKLLREATKRR